MHSTHCSLRAGSTLSRKSSLHNTNKKEKEKKAEESKKGWREEGKGSEAAQRGDALLIGGRAHAAGRTRLGVVAPRLADRAAGARVALRAHAQHALLLRLRAAARHAQQQQPQHEPPR